MLTTLERIFMAGALVTSSHCLRVDLSTHKEELEHLTSPGLEPGEPMSVLNLLLVTQLMLTWETLLTVAGREETSGKQWFSFQSYTSLIFFLPGSIQNRFRIYKKWEKETTSIQPDNKTLATLEEEALIELDVIENF